MKSHLIIWHPSAACEKGYDMWFSAFSSDVEFLSHFRIVYCVRLKRSLI